MQFDNPVLLVLLILIPITAWVGWPSNGAGYRRDVLNLLLRTVMLVCLVFSLAGFNLVHPTNDLAVVFLMDVSDSVSTTSKAAELAYVRSALNAMGNNDQAAVVVFGGNAVVERSMSSKKVWITSVQPRMSIRQILKMPSALG